MADHGAFAGRDLRTPSVHWSASTVRSGAKEDEDLRELKGALDSLRFQLHAVGAETPVAETSPTRPVERPSAHAVAQAALSSSPGNGLLLHSVLDSANSTATELGMKLTSQANFGSELRKQV